MFLTARTQRRKEKCQIIFRPRLACRAAIWLSNTNEHYAVHLIPLLAKALWAGEGGCVKALRLARGMFSTKMWTSFF